MIVDLHDVRAVQSVESRKFEWVHEQGFDTSCGYASVASLLELYWGQKTSEQELLQSLVRPDDDTFSLSMADARRMIEYAGFDARGYRLSWDQLAAVLGRNAPVLVHYDKPNGHFALLLSINRDRVVVADPARGLEVLSRLEFEQRWSGAALFVGSTTKARNQGALSQAITSALARADTLERDAVRIRSPFP